MHGDRNGNGNDSPRCCWMRVISLTLGHPAGNRVRWGMRLRGRGRVRNPLLGHAERPPGGLLLVLVHVHDHAAAEYVKVRVGLVRGCLGVIGIGRSVVSS
jgi:hypothetical protein